MPRNRNYRSEYQRRNELARERGWRSYNQERSAYRSVYGTDVWDYWARHGYITPDNENEAVKALNEMRYEDDSDYGPGSWHYYYFVEVLGYMTAEEWADHYPTGARTYGL